MDDKPKEKTFFLLGWIAVVSLIESVGLFIKTYNWAVQIPGFLHQASLQGITKTIGAFSITVGILQIYSALACTAVMMAIGLVFHKEWARIMAIVLYALSGLMFLSERSFVTAVIHALVVLYLCRKDLREEFQKSAQNITPPEIAADSSSHQQ